MSRSLPLVALLFLAGARLAAAVDVRELLTLGGWSESDLAAFVDNQPWTADQTRATLKLLDILNRLPNDRLSAAPLDAASLTAIDNETERQRGELFRFQAAAGAVASIEPDQDTAARFADQTLFRVTASLADGRAVEIYTLSVPKQWAVDRRATGTVACEGVLLKRADSQTLVFATSHVAWRPHTLLGELGMDVRALEAVHQRRRLDARDGEAFYGLLAAAGSVTPEEFAQRAAATTPADIKTEILAIFKSPESYVGKLFEIDGTLRRAVRVTTSDNVARQFGFDHYYELEIFVNVPNLKADSNPVLLVCCVRSPPPGVSTGDDIRKRVRAPAFFLKLWTFESGFARQMRPGSRQLAPLLIGNSFRIVPIEPQNRWGLSLLAGLAVAAIVVVLLAVMAMNARDRRRARRAIAATEPARIESLDW